MLSRGITEAYLTIVQRCYRELLAGALSDLDTQPLDFLVEGRERNAKLISGVGLIPIAAFELLYDDSAFDVFHYVEERSVGIMCEQCVLEASAGDVAGQ